MLKTIQKTLLVLAALAALALGGSALAGAADKPSTTTTPGSRPQQNQLTGDTAAKVKAAALDKVPGATVLRVESGGPSGSAYHAHIKTSDGKLQVVLVDDSFKATAVQADNGPGGRGRGGPGGKHGRGGPGAGEKPLTGDTKDKVEAAVLDKYPGSTIVRTETNGDSAAAYESHITTKDGKELEVLVNKDFEVVTTRTHP
jgi:uncharacterized membrane protein YkoI